MLRVETIGQIDSVIAMLEADNEGEALSAACTQADLDLWSSIELLRGFEKSVYLLQGFRPDTPLDEMGLVLNTPWVPIQEAAQKAGTCAQDPVVTVSAVSGARSNLDHLLSIKLESCRKHGWLPLNQRQAEE